MTPTLPPLESAFAAKRQECFQIKTGPQGCKLGPGGCTLVPPVSLFPIGSLRPLDPLAHLGGSGVAFLGLYIKMFSLMAPEARG